MFIVCALGLFVVAGVIYSSSRNFESSISGVGGVGRAANNAKGLASQGFAIAGGIALIAAAIAGRD